MNTLKTLKHSRAMRKVKGYNMKQKEDDKTIDMVDVYDQEEAHYVHTINAFVELIVMYGYDKVVGDLRTVMGNKTW